MLSNKNFVLFNFISLDENNDSAPSKSKADRFIRHEIVVNNALSNVLPASPKRTMHFSRVTPVTKRNYSREKEGHKVVSKEP